MKKQRYSKIIILASIIAAIILVASILEIYLANQEYDKYLNRSIESNLSIEKVPTNESLCLNPTFNEFYNQSLGKFYCRLQDMSTNG